MSSRELPLPTFLVIGAQKCATRWLRFNLGLHPEVYAAPAELSFFNNRSRFEQLGPAWYRERFEGWSGEPIVGEATPGYMFWRHRPRICAERVLEIVPDVRLIAILRNPIDRAQSAMIHHIVAGALDEDSNLLDLVEQTPPLRDRLGLITGGWYAKSLMPYRRMFRDKLLVLLHDDLEADARAAYRRAAEHIGATPGFVPPDLERVRFSNRPRRGIDGDRVPALTIEQRRKLYEYFAEDQTKLQRMLGRDLSMWNPDRS
jgi:Sulfotransferase domain